jgi:hypothetical protein
MTLNLIQNIRLEQKITTIIQKSIGIVQKGFDHIKENACIQIYTQSCPSIEGISGKKGRICWKSCFHIFFEKGGAEAI